MFVLYLIGQKKVSARKAAINAITVPKGQKSGDKAKNPIDDAEMVWVPAGEFLMGSNNKDEEACANEKPQHKIYLDGYYVYKYEVTVAQYRKFCEDTNREMPEEPFWGWKDNYPIVMVSWNDAKAYADWARACLPSEAQWEKAARGQNGRIFTWGDVWDEDKYANRENSEQAQLVGTFPDDKSVYGALDMIGNISEWCSDWFDEKYYKKSTDKNPSGPKTGTLRVIRGGSWADDGSTYYRSAYRSHGKPDGKFDNCGFRCVMPK